MAHTQDRHEMRDGRVILYRRDDVADLTWHCRIRIPGLNKYIRKSCKTTDFHQAKQFADDLYAVNLHKFQNNTPVFSKTFDQVADQLEVQAKRDYESGELSKGRYDLLTGTLRRYLRPKYGKKAIDAISMKDIAEYEDWRLEYWKTGLGAQLEQKPRNVRLTPARKTIQIEIGYIRMVFEMAVKMGLLQPSQIPYIEHKKYKTNRRPAFTRTQFKKLQGLSRQRIKEAKNPRVKRDREMLHAYIQFMVHSGLRVGEARYLRWSDISYTKDSTAENQMISISVNGKTGRRDVVPMSVITGAIMRLGMIVKKDGINFEDSKLVGESDRYVFSNPDGSVKKSFANGFDSLLKAAKMDRYKDGNKYTLYSLRHTFATFRLLYGDTDVFKLSVNMGTSVKMIEDHYGHIVAKDVAAELTKNPNFMTAD